MGSGRQVNCATYRLLPDDRLAPSGKRGGWFGRKRNVFCWSSRRGRRFLTEPFSVSFDLFGGGGHSILPLQNDIRISVRQYLLSRDTQEFCGNVAVCGRGRVGDRQTKGLGEPF